MLAMFFDEVNSNVFLFIAKCKPSYKIQLKDVVNAIVHEKWETNGVRIVLKRSRIVQESITSQFVPLRMPKRIKHLVFSKRR